jgi:hypothetical protein
MLHKISRTVRRSMRWIFGAPFKDLPPGFGEPLPEIRAFEEQVREMRPRPHGDAPVASTRRHEHAESAQ